jgi:hypothetical protein
MLYAVRKLQELSSSSSSPLRQTNPVSYAFMHLSKEAKRQNLRALKLLFGYLKIPGGDLEEQGQAFLDIARGGGTAGATEQV